jgi:hypothetical protein
MTTDQTIASYRAAAAKLAEALAAGAGVCSATNIVHDAEVLLTDYPEARGGMSQCGDWRDKYYDEDGWRWITEAARLRLLLEALILEQEQSATTAREMGWYASQDDLEDLGALVRRVLLAGPTAATSDVSRAPADRGAP